MRVVVVAKIANELAVCQNDQAAFVSLRTSRWLLLLGSLIYVTYWTALVLLFLAGWLLCQVLGIGCCCQMLCR